MRPLFSIIFALLIGASLSPLAATNTEWVQHGDMLRTRIVASSLDSASGRVLLAWEADLQPGWKTYWRSPGEAGLPVRVSVDGTEQELLYPVPERFEIFGLTTYGYKGRVLLPFYVNAEDADKSIEASFMVCKEICVPFDTAYSLPDDLSSDSIHDIRIASWMDKVPSKAPEAGLEISAIRVTGKAGRQRLIVDVAGSATLSDADLLAEVEGIFEFGAPVVRLQGDGTKARFVLPVMTMRKELDLRGRDIRLTVIDGRGHAIDRTIKVES